jgi:glucan phosphoethanolaminetransferase (alkaline phosphatase superfamily)
VLVAIKLAHTFVWAVLAGFIVVLPWYIARRRWRPVAWLIAIVFAECVVLAVNGMRCPLTDLAARYTSDRSASFDIYLPAWLARNNKLIFGTIFGLELIWAAVLKWSAHSRKRSPEASSSNTAIG